VVPVLFGVLSFLGVDPEIRMHVAVATSLATIIPTSINSIRSHHRKGAVDWMLAKRWGGMVVAGAVAGGWMANYLRSGALSLVFAIVALGVAAFLTLRNEGTCLAKAVPGGFLGRLFPFGIGTISALMGIGGGSLSVPILSACSFPVHRAVATASVFGLLIAVPGAVAFAISGWGAPSLPPLSLGFVSIIGFVFIAPLQTLFAPLGARLAHALPGPILRRLFALFLVATSVKMFLNFLGSPGSG
jgi:uncharacterized protein